MSNLKQHIPSDLPVHNQYIPANNLKSQQRFDEINQWTNAQKMQINAKKTTSMVFNYTEKYQFSTRLLLINEKIENLKSTKLLGTIISDDLTWDLNTLKIVTKANAIMEFAFCWNNQ